MKSVPASEAREVWTDIRDGIFSHPMIARIIQEQARYVDDRTYVDLRNTSEAKILELIDSLCIPDLPMEQLQSTVQAAPINHQLFLYERFLYVVDYLAQLGEEEFFYEDKPADFLRFGLVDLWNRRPRDKEY